MPDRAPLPSYRWQDIAPVARLHFERTGTTLIVVDHPGGRPLPFAPLHVFGTARPGEAGSSLIIVHAETHRQMITNLREGDPISACPLGGQPRRYRVESLRVIDPGKQRVWSAALAREEIQLIASCPANAKSAANYVVTAVPA